MTAIQARFDHHEKRINDLALGLQRIKALIAKTNEESTKLEQIVRTIKESINKLLKNSNILSKMEVETPFLSSQNPVLSINVGLFQLQNIGQTSHIENTIPNLVLHSAFNRGIVKELSKRIYMFPEIYKLVGSENFDQWKQALTIMFKALGLPLFVDNPLVTRELSDSD